MDRQKIRICASGSKCGLCRRDTVSGDEFRKEHLGDERADCPYQVPWNIDAGPLRAHFRKYRTGTKLKMLLHKILSLEACKDCHQRVQFLDLDFGAEGLTGKTPPPTIEEQWQDES